MNDRHDEWGGRLLVVLAMALCCGGPLLVIALVTVGPPLLAALSLPGVVVLAAGAVAAVAAIVVLRPRASSCSDCELPGTQVTARDDRASTQRSRPHQLADRAPVDRGGTAR